MALLLGLDLGTSYFKAGLFDASGRLAGLGRVPTPITRAGTRAEMPVAEFWRSLRSAVAQALTAASADAARVRAISYSSQANTFLLLDQAGTALTPFLAWTDQRAAPLEPTLAAFGDSDVFLQTAGFAGLAPGFAVAKWNWLRRHEPALAARAAKLATISDFLTSQLTGADAGDANTAALTGAWDVRGECWWADALRTYGLSPGQLVAPRAPGSSIGRTNASAAELLGLPSGIPFVAGALDHFAAAVGAGVGPLGPVSISIGTVLAAVRLGGYEVKRGCYLSPSWKRGEYCRLTFSVPGAGVVEEFRQKEARAHSYELLLQGASETPQADRRLSELRRLIEGLAADHARLLETLGAGASDTSLLATGGGARSRHWLQIVADVLKRPIVAPATEELACLGAAVFAATALGSYRDVADAAAAMCRPGTTLFPRYTSASGVHSSGR